MISHYRIVQVICFVAMIITTPATFFMAVLGEFLWAAILVIVSIITFIGFVESTRRIRHHREMQNNYSHKHVKPI